jgi:CHAT domain-containing protein
VASVAFGINSNKSYLQKAFYFMEKSKGNILMDRINELRARNYAGIPKPVLDEEFRVKGELSIYKEQLLKHKGTDSLYTQLKSQYDDKLREYTRVISELEEKFPRYYRLKYDVSTVRIEEIQKLLPSNHSLMLQYYIGNEKIYIAGITKKEVIIKIIARDEAFDRNLELILKQIGNPNVLEVENDPLLFKEFVQTARYLYLNLLAPVLDAARPSVNELIIIPDGYLCYLPFEILLTTDFESELPAYADLPYLLNDYEVRYDYSASLIAGNSNWNISSRDIYAGYAPSYHSGSLYANREEVESCSKIWDGTSFLDNRATETSFRNLPPSTSIIHLAAHSFLNDANPQNSSFALYPDELHHEDGLLYTYELYDMTLPASLVILSGCETGIGNFKKGEGIISLARAFKFAGCQNIVMSLWKVNDRATKEIMIGFNKNLKKGMQKDRALRLAKKDYLKNSGNLHPAFWSSFVLIGNDSPLRKNKNQAIIFSGILCCLMVLSWFIYRKSRLIHR